VKEDAVSKSTVAPKPTDAKRNHGLIAVELLCPDLDIKSVSNGQVLELARNWARLNHLALAGMTKGPLVDQADVDLLHQVSFTADAWASEALHRFERFGRKAVA
jgi:hypothetical protein